MAFSVHTVTAGITVPLGKILAAERMVAYPPLLWMVMFGGYLLGESGDRILALSSSEKGAPRA